MSYHDQSTAVIVVNYKKPEDTIQCIRSLLAAGRPESLIIVVDNGSADGSADRIAEALPGLRLLRLDENLGYAGGYNAGIEQALALQTPNILILNNDTIVDRQAIDLLREAAWDISVPKIYYHDPPDLIWAAGARWRKFPPRVTMIGYRRKDRPGYDIPYELEYATGCALLIKRPVLETLGGFDPLFINYMEDYDFCYRARQQGYSIGYVPQAHVWHKVALTLGESSPERWKYLGRNSVLFYRKGERFPSSVLWMYLVWFTLREMVKGQLSRVRFFWQGVIEGRQLLKSSGTV